MKKNVLKATALVLALLSSSSASAQIDLNNVLGGVIEATSNNNSSTGDLISNLTTVFSKNKQAKSENIIGTWSYTEPAIVFMSDNILTKAAAKIAANKLEKKLQSYLTQYGIKPGSFVMTFNEDGTFTESLNGKKMSGKWKVVDSKLQLTVTGIKTISITTQIDGKDMQFVTDATKLLNLFKTLGAKSTNSNIKTITSLMKSVNGMQAGITLRKQ
jgi:hypothetical protein